MLQRTELFFGTENLKQFLSPSRAIACLIRMPLVKSFCHTNLAQLKISQRGKGLFDIKRSGGYCTFYVFSFLQLVFLGYIHEIFPGVGSVSVYTWHKQNTWYGWALPCRKRYHCHSFQGYSDVTIYYFEASQYLIVSILMSGCKVPFCYKISTDIWLELDLTICFYAGHMNSWSRRCLGTWITHLHEATKHLTLEV